MIWLVNQYSVKRSDREYPVIDVKRTGKNIKRLMDKRNISVSDVKEYLGLESVQSIYNWIHGINMPSIDNLYALSALVQVSIDSIVCGNKDIDNFEIDYQLSYSSNQHLLLYANKIREYNTVRY